MNIDPNEENPHFQNAPAGKQGYLVEFSKPQAAAPPTGEAIFPNDVYQPGGGYKVPEGAGGGPAATPPPGKPGSAGQTP